MTMAPNPGKILELLTAMDQGLAAGQEFDSALVDLLPELVETRSAIDALRVFRPTTDANKHTLIASSEKADTSAGDTKAVAQVLADHLPIKDEDRWYIPLWDTDGIAAVMAARLNDDSGEAGAWLQWLAGQLSRSFTQSESRKSRDRLMLHLAETFASLSAHHTLDENLDLLYSRLFRQYGAEISVFDISTNAQGQLSALRVLASTLDDHFEWETVPAGLQEISDSPIAHNFLVNDSQAVHMLGKAYLQRLSAKGMQRIVIWPMIVENNLVAFFLAALPTAAELTDNQLLVFVRAIGRTSMLLHAGQLISEVQATRMTADNLVLSSRLITTAESYNDMAQAAVYTIARNMTAIALSLFDTALDAETQPTGRSLIALGVAEGTVEVSESDFVPLLPDTAQLADLARGQHIVLEQRPTDGFALAVQTYDRLDGEHSIVWLAAFGLHVGNQVLGTLEIMHRSPHHLTAEEIDAYNTLSDQIGVSVHNRQLLQQSLNFLEDAQTSADSLSNQVSVLRTLNELSAFIRVATTEDQLLQQSVQALVQASGVDYGRAYLLDAALEYGEIVSEYPGRDQVGQRLPVADLLVSLLAGLDDRQSPVIANVTTSTELDDRLRASLQQDKVTSFMLLPLFVQDQLAGYIRLDIRQSDKHFSDEALEIAQTILVQVAIGLQNIRFLKESRRRSAQLEEVSTFAHALQISLDQDAVLATVVSQIHSVIPITWIQISLLDEENDSLREAAVYNSNIPDDNRISSRQSGPVIMLENGSPITHVWNNQALLHVSDISRANWIMPKNAKALRSLVVTPLRAGTKLLGIFVVGHIQPFVYTETDIIVFQQLADQVATAIENATLFAKSQRGERNEALVNEIAIRLQQQGDIEQMLQIAATDLGKALGARRARVRLGVGKAVEQASSDERSDQ